MSQTTQLDTEELMHLALHASNNNQTDKAINHLKQILDIEPDNGKAHYLLGALHAEIGMYPRAIEEMSRAVELEPNIPTAHFQLGLLYITSGMVEEADKAWQPLNELGEENALFLFKRGMLSLVKDEFESCIADLNKGISLNDFNQALNNDMAKIIAEAENALGQNKSNQIPQKPEEKKGQSGKHVLLSAYKQQEYENE